MLREEQIHRYARHIVLGAVGVRGQEALLEASVTVAVGEANASSHCALSYLAAAGVGTIVLIGDLSGAVTRGEVDRSLAFEVGDIGRPRFEALRERISELNPDVTLRRGSTDDLATFNVSEHGDLSAAIAAGARVATHATLRIISRALGRDG